MRLCITSGCPPARAVGLVVSEELVWRDQFYDGHPRQERAAVVLRMAPLVVSDRISGDTALLEGVHTSQATCGLSH